METMTARVIATMKVTRFVFGSWESGTRPDTTDANAMRRIEPYVRARSWVLIYAGSSRSDVTAIAVSVRGHGPEAWKRAEERGKKLAKKYGGTNLPEWDGVEVGASANVVQI